MAVIIRSLRFMRLQKVLIDIEVPNVVVCCLDFCEMSQTKFPFPFVAQSFLRSHPGSGLYVLLPIRALLLTSIFWSVITPLQSSMNLLCTTNETFQTQPLTTYVQTLYATITCDPDITAHESGYSFSAFVHEVPTMQSSSKSRRHRPPAAKRRRIGGPTSEDDEIPTPQSQTNAPSASALSTRTLPSDHIASLTTLCIQVFANDLLNVPKDQSVMDSINQWMKIIPDTLIPRVFAALRQTCPMNLTHAFIVAVRKATYELKLANGTSQNLLRGSSITLTDNLPGVMNMTVSAIVNSPAKESLQELELSGLQKLPDTTVASTISRLPSLRTLILR